jgi:pimeloyl-ACP methyl ester carboxylesterase
VFFRPLVTRFCNLVNYIFSDEIKKTEGSIYRVIIKKRRLKQRLIILSDLNGIVNSEWLEEYRTNLYAHFDLREYDTRELAEIESNGLTETEIHEKFINGGIEKAISNLLEKEKKPSIVLGFSVGGTIAWKAALQGMPIQKLIAVSSTRLRKEYQKPNGVIDLFYGENDLYRPMDEWFEAMQLAPTIFARADHELYKDEKFVHQILADILQEMA